MTCMFTFGPTIGAGVNITLISYQGPCELGVNIDSGRCPTRMS